MKNSTLFFRSIAVIILLTGSAHLVGYASKTSLQNTQNQLEEMINEAYSTSKNYNETTDYIIGKWKLNYNSKDFKGAIVYTIKKEGNLFNAYTYSYEDTNGNIEKADKTKALTIQSFDGYKGSGTYKIEYEQQVYDVACTIDMINENTFKLSYDYYGYGDVETWKRQ
ncbi:hypothetical protein [Tenacibaculum amylolyticum]|uniref:hypothetical protein n=1 Tax=Tenacibaculum amylolyticum TaxID=104269 RepID=UPI003893A12E